MTEIDNGDGGGGGKSGGSYNDDNRVGKVGDGSDSENKNIKYKETFYKFWKLKLFKENENINVFSNQTSRKSKRVLEPKLSHQVI